MASTAKKQTQIAASDIAQQLLKGRKHSKPAGRGGDYVTLPDSRGRTACWLLARKDYCVILNIKAGSSKGKKIKVTDKDIVKANKALDSVIAASEKRPAKKAAPKPKAKAPKNAVAKKVKHKVNQELQEDRHRQQGDRRASHRLAPIRTHDEARRDPGLASSRELVIEEVDLDASLTMGRPGGRPSPHAASPI